MQTSENGNKPNSPIDVFRSMEAKFNELYGSVIIANEKIDQVFKLNSIVSSVLEKTNTDLHLLGVEKGLMVACQHYNSLFRSRQLCEVSSFKEELDSLIKGLKNDLEQLAVEVIEPIIGDKLDLQTMAVVDFKPVKVKKKSDTVCEIKRVGFIMKNKILQKSEVIIYKRS